MQARLPLCFALCLLGDALVSRAVPALSTNDAANPYQAIIARNAFALKPPPPPPDPEASKPTPSKITLTGMTTILGKKQVLLKTAPTPPKPGETPKGDQSYILTVGQREGDIEILEIDEIAGSVKLNNAGVVATLTFEKDGAKLPATAAPPAPGGPGQPGGAPGVLPPPGGAPGAAPGATPPGFTMPSRLLRSNAGAGAPGSGAPVAGVPGAVGAQPNALPGTTAESAIAQQAAAQRSVEENVLLYEANRLKNEQLINSGARLPRMPRHPYTEGSPQ
jgi:hypothetical protein